MATKNIAKQAVKNATVAAKAPTVAATKAAPRILEDTKPKAVENPQDFVGRICKVIGGKKFTDESVSVYYVAANPNKWGAVNAMVVDQDGNAGQFVNVKYLQDTGKPMDAKLLKKLQSERQEAADETVYVAAFSNTIMDGKTGNPKSVQLRNSGWFAPIYFKTEWVVTTNAIYDDKPIFEVPAWVIRSRAGNDALDAVRAKQDEFAALVEAAG